MTTVSCPSCAAATPLPDEDLQRETYACPACGQLVRTADVVGARVVAADAFVREMDDVLAGKAERPSTSPGDHAAAPPRASRCVDCQAPVDVPMDLRVHDLECPSCHRVQAVAAHVSDAERLHVDQERQIAQNQALREARAAGLACPGCGAHVQIPAEAVQAVCGRCGSAVSLASVAGQDALARERLGRGVRAAVDRAVAAQDTRARWVNRLIVGGLLGLAVLVVGGAVLVSVVGAALAAFGLR